MESRGVSRRALSLLETLICGLLISCVLLGVVGLFVGGTRAIRHAEQQEAAGRVAEQALEKARATPFPDLHLGQTPLPATNQDDVHYRGIQEVFSDPTITNLKRVRVTVFWRYQNRSLQLVREGWVNAVKG